MDWWWLCVLVIGILFDGSMHGFSVRQLKKTPEKA